MGPELVVREEACEGHVRRMVIQPGPPSAPGVTRDPKGNAGEPTRRSSDLRQLFVLPKNADDEDVGGTASGRPGGRWRKRGRWIADDDPLGRPGANLAQMNRVCDDDSRRPPSEEPLQGQAPAPFRAVEDSRMAVHHVTRSLLKAVYEHGRDREDWWVHDKDDFRFHPVQPAQRGDELGAVLDRGGDNISLPEVANIHRGQPQAIDKTLAAPMVTKPGHERAFSPAISHGPIGHDR